jgi:hypothetical protein
MWDKGIAMFATDSGSYSIETVLLVQNHSRVMCPPFVLEFVL